MPSTQQVPPGTPGVSTQYNLILPQQEFNIIALALFKKAGLCGDYGLQISFNSFGLEMRLIFNKSEELNQPEALIQGMLSCELRSGVPCVRHKGTIHCLPSTEGSSWESLSVSKMSLKP